MTHVSGVCFVFNPLILVDMLNTSTDMLVMNQSEDYRQIQENRYQIDQIVCHNCRNFVIKKIYSLCILGISCFSFFFNLEGVFRET